MHTNFAVTKEKRLRLYDGCPINKTVPGAKYKRAQQRARCEEIRERFSLTFQGPRLSSGTLQYIIYNNNCWTD